jgi:L-ectoine synthase
MLRRSKLRSPAIGRGQGRLASRWHTRRTRLVDGLGDRDGGRSPVPPLAEADRRCRTGYRPMLVPDGTACATCHACQAVACSKIRNTEAMIMIVRTLDEILDSPRDVRGKGWQSRRLLLRADRMGFSLSDTVVAEGTEQRLEYKHHLEANYCIAGEGEVVDLRTGAVHPLRPGTLYALDKNDAHIVRATRGDLRVVCVFNPPLAGDETHRPDGSYGPPDDAATP